MHRRDGKLIISPTDLVGFLACGHLTQLERAAADNLVNKPKREDPEVELLRRRGGMHEERYLDKLRAEGREICDLQHERVEGQPGPPYEQRAAETIAAMSRGEDVIFQATVFDDRWVGHPDFLLRKPSVAQSGRGGELGRDFHYEVADTKLAHSAKASALIQICAYVEQVERIQGVRPERVCVVTGGAEIGEHSFRTAEMMAYYRHAKRAYEAALDESVSGKPVFPIPPESSYPDPVGHCQVCRWFYEHCRQQWRDDDALPLVAGISRRQRQALAQNSVATMLALSELGDEMAIEGLKTHQREAMRRVRDQARLQVASKDQPVPRYELLPADGPDGNPSPDRGLAALPPPSEGDLFFDIEGDPFAHWSGLDYLFGVWTSDGQWRCLWAMYHAAEKQAFEELMDRFIEQLDRYPDMHIYHYAPYEPTALKRLAGRHGAREEEVDRLLRGKVLVDLYRVVRQSLLAGVESYSIKRLEPLYGFTREVELRDANSSIVEFERILEIGDPTGELKKMIEAYNRDDCVSTQRLRDWLEERRVEHESTFSVQLPRPTAGEETSAELAEREQQVLELERRLAEGVPAERELHTDEQHGSWLLAQLLDWHRREGKSAWWRFFDLMGRSDDELFEEREPISHLTYEGIVTEVGRSFVHRYKFPPGQEHRVEEGKELHDPRLESSKTRSGAAERIDSNNGILEIRRVKAWAGTHPTAVVPLDIFRVPEQQAALMEIGRWVAEHDIDSPLPDHRAIRDLLMRRAPRLADPQPGNLVRDGETGTQAARRLVTQLDGATLAIQGPPGSGKTYSGARMIIDLVRAGRVVGVTSNSHKVIGNLLRATCAAAQEEGIELRALQKGDEHEVREHPFVKRAGEIADIATALGKREVDVVAGTAWLWAHKSMRDTVDTLFIDEAGQVSLANVAATSVAAQNIVLLGDPQQLDQPIQGVHPPGADRSALAHFLDEAETVPPDRGVFLGETWRMNDDITGYTSELYYEGLLRSVEGLANQRVLGDDWLAGSGLRWVPVEHDGNTNASVEEAKAVAQIVQSLVGRRWVDKEGDEQQIGLRDIVIVSPFNAHRLLIQQELGPDAFVGTVDKFQGQEAPVSIYTMATSRPEDAPRGMDFLYSLNRLNVATSRARALAIVVASDKLLKAVPRTPDQLRMVNGLCAFVEMASQPPSEASAVLQQDAAEATPRA